MAVQAFANVETLGGDAPLSLFCLTIAESGERKSTCDKVMMAAARDFERELARQHRADQDEWDNARELWEGKRKRLMTDAASGKDKAKATAAEADLRALGPCPSAPLLPFLTVQEPTLAGVAKLLIAGRPSIGLFNDDAGGFVGGHAMSADNRANTVAGLSKLWDGDGLDRIRAGDGASKMPGRRMAAHLMAQPVIALPLLADPLASGQGFHARFLVAEPTSTIGSRLRRGHDPASDIALAAFGARLTAILETPVPTGDSQQELEPRRLPMSTGARELLWRYYQTIEAAQTTGGPMEHVRPYASKSAEQAARIAGVLTLWGDLNALEVAPEAMGLGVTLAQFYLGEARRLAEAGSVSADTAKAERLRQWLVESWPHDDVIPREIVQLGPNALRDGKALAGPIGMLVKAGHLVPLDSGIVIRGSARREAYRIVRSAHAV